VILESVLLRREKTMRDRDGKMIVQLPDKVVCRWSIFILIKSAKFECNQVKHEYLDFGILERKIYDDIYSNVKRKFNSLSAKGLVGKNYTNILAMLMKYGSHLRIGNGF
jgi:DNA repair protein RAD5